MSSPAAGRSAVRNVRMRASPRWPADPVTSTLLCMEYLEKDRFSAIVPGGPPGPYLMQERALGRHHARSPFRSRSLDVISGTAGATANTTSAADGAPPPNDAPVTRPDALARYDEMGPQDMKKMAQLMPNASAADCDQGSLLCVWDDQESYFF